MSFLRRLLPLLTLALAIAALYLYKLDGVGVLGPDEPRYAAIGEAMAHSGDYITPHLWGAAWFEKPPLLYWMIATATLAGLNPDLAARLPVALLSLAFLVIFFCLIKREFGREAGIISAACLATCAGWVAYSGLALTDLPLAAFFSLSVCLALPLLRKDQQTPPVAPRFLLIGICMGLAILAKGLVPIVLSAPFLWFLRRFWTRWWIAVFSALAIALPWYVAAYVRNGPGFLEEFFWKQHFERLYSPVLQHVQPWYYYFPVLLAGLFPWTPLFALLFVRPVMNDNRRCFLLAIFLFGFVFFSVSLNKLPGYLLPLFPSLYALLGSQFETRMLAELSRLWLLPSALLIGCVPLLAFVVPESLIAGRVAVRSFGPLSATELFYIFLPLAVVFLGRRSWLGPLLVLCIVGGGIYLKTMAYPVLNERASARRLWQQRLKNLPGAICDAGTNRDWTYGLSFYRGALIPPCGSGAFQFMLRSNGHGPPSLTRIR